MNYPDKWPRLIGIPVWAFFFRLIGDITPVGDLLKSSQFYLDILVITGVTGILWEGNRFLIRYLDRQYSWATQSTQRLFIQGGVAMGCTALVIALFSFIYNDIVIERPPQATLSILIANDVPIGLLFTTLLHMGYTMYWLLAYHRQVVADLQLRIAELEANAPGPLPAPAPESRSNEMKTLLVNQGKGFVPLATEQVAYIFVANETSIVKTVDNQSFTVDATLEQLSERLPSSEFFRTNRQFIASRVAIRKVENDGSGRLLLHLHPRPAEEIAVSRRRVPEFRQWLGAS
ncbi:LytTR family DNA-binding domain-containing protein [Telluribacter sp. SYSU D00476]|uniref:LytR/AlgR family response regulator transcription factor n=1 Tax=Telluribacter sp. SYSU D00476 TaxID=2811430 RepID=UPI001FF1F389|nr:LytTR family DNA-binding domain-containing protein [Telluribacter sp. SYSU D00476]